MWKPRDDTSVTGVEHPTSSTASSTPATAEQMFGGHSWNRPQSTQQQQQQHQQQQHEFEIDFWIRTFELCYLLQQKQQQQVSSRLRRKKLEEKTNVQLTARQEEKHHLQYTRRSTTTHATTTSIITTTTTTTTYPTVLKMFVKQVFGISAAPKPFKIFRDRISILEYFTLETII